MSKTLRSLAALTLPLIGFVNAAYAQVEDWQSVATACTPATIDSLALPQFNTVGGFIRAPLGAENPQLRYTCNVLDSFATFVPTWNRMQLQYLDTVGGSISATLYSKNKVTGATAIEAFVASPAAGAINNVNVALPALNFAINAHYVVVAITPRNNARPQAHQVVLAF